VRGISADSTDPLSAQTRWQTLEALGLGGLLTALVAGIAVALAAAEGRNDMATLAAIGASPRKRRMLGAGHGLFLGLTGTALGLLIGLPAGLSLTQLDGLDGVQVPWVAAGATVLLVPLVTALAGWVVTPTRLTLVRRGG
jgi:putative ABC transport system permease protein